MVLDKMKMGFIFVLTYMCFLVPVHQAKPPSANISDLSFKNIDFAFNLYRKISSYHDRNIFFSPLSVSTSFAALSMASAGVTHEEILKGLNLEQLEQADQPEFIPQLFQQLHGNVTHNGSLKVDQAMAIFLHKQFDIKTTFEDEMKKYFYADSERVNFTDTKQTIGLINEYVKNKTEGKVTDMISTLDAQTQLMLINTIFFQGNWELPFNPNYTNNAPFYIDNYNIVQVPMMFKEDKFYTMEDHALGARVLKLSYQEGVSMLILLPKKGVDYTIIDDEITAEKFLGWTKKMYKIKLEVNMPKFKLEKSYPLHKILPEMGVASIFSHSANLSRLSMNEGLKVSEVLHKAVIDVDETGTIAAAATAIGIIPYSLPRTFSINKPFFFFIYHEETNCLLFMGRVIDPTKN